MSESPRIGPFTEEQLVSRTDPFAQFRSWRNEAAVFSDFSAMCLSTCSKEGKPSSRMVELVSFDQNGLVFISNSNSRKARDMRENPYASVVIMYIHQNRQVRVEGKVGPIGDSKVVSDRFHSLSRERQYTLLLSMQGEKLSGWEEQVQMRKIVEAQYRDVADPLPFPPQISGYLLVPERFEFLQNHQEWFGDRIVFEKQVDGTWSFCRLMP